MEWFLFPAGTKSGDVLQNPYYVSVKLDNSLKKIITSCTSGHTKGMTAWMRTDRLMLHAPALSWPDAN